MRNNALGSFPRDGVRKETGDEGTRWWRKKRRPRCFVKGRWRTGDVIKLYPPFYISINFRFRCFISFYIF